MIWGANECVNGVHVWIISLNKPSPKFRSLEFGGGQGGGLQRNRRLVGMGGTCKPQAADRHLIPIKGGQVSLTQYTSE